MRLRLAQHGVHWRAIRGEAFVDDVSRLLPVARAAFCGNPFYVDPDEREFVGRCQRLRHVAPLDFVRVACDRDRIVGFVFAVPDQLQAERRETIDTLIIKTLAIVPDRCYAGLGQVLLSAVKQDAAAAGFRRAVHALVRDVPHLRRISQRTARPMRRYALFAKALTS